MRSSGILFLSSLRVICCECCLLPCCMAPANMTFCLIAGLVCICSTAFLPRPTVHALPCKVLLTSSVYGNEVWSLPVLLRAWDSCQHRCLQDWLGNPGVIESLCFPHACMAWCFLAFARLALDSGQLLLQVEGIFHIRIFGCLPLSIFHVLLLDQAGHHAICANGHVLWLHGNHILQLLLHDWYHWVLCLLAVCAANIRRSQNRLVVCSRGRCIRLHWF